ncbi:MAG: hypothetical protein A2W31_03310 [Planctomycetes bacterium RBG_16_64_10]|nr:MAG: hypothetical protein A2W31_03310 [Planctomycetes bacterium RBG_16_64_10]
MLTGAVSAGLEPAGRVRPMGPASKVVPRVKAAFVRRRAPYGMRWPGAVYDGPAARAQYTAALHAAATRLGLQVDLRGEPIYDLAEAETWVAEAKTAAADCLLVLLQDRQEHAWPTATLAAESGLPTIVHAPLGTSFTTNTRDLARKQGCILCATDDFGQVADGLAMVRAHCRLRATRYVVLQGDQRYETQLAQLGTTLRYLPAADFLEAYQNSPVTDEIRTVAKAYMERATGITSGSPEDVIRGVKSYVVARQILEREEGDAITMDCLGALGKSSVSLPCIAWSHLLDQGIPAACEADINACATHALVQYLLERPGFQQDPVADTSRGTLIGAHCTCPTRLHGLDQPPAAYDIRHHHGNRDAVPRPVWPIGQRATVVQFVLSQDETQPPQMIISTGAVTGNRAVPPAGGCVVSVELKLDGVSDCLDYPGFHQLFVCGDFGRPLRAYCQLFGVEPILV